MYFANLAIHRIYDSRHFLAFYISIFSLFFSIYLIFFFYFKVICLLKENKEINRNYFLFEKKINDVEIKFIYNNFTSHVDKYV